MGSRSGQLPTETDLIDITDVLEAYYKIKPDVDNPHQKVVFGTSGHRGASQKGSYNQAHVVAITAALVDYRRERGLGGKVFIGIDTHLLSLPAFRTTLEVLAGAGVGYVIDSHITAELLDSAEKGEAPKGCAIWTPTPAVSYAILQANAGKTDKKDMSDGVIITPSHNPPTDGGYKYNPENGGLADNDITNWIANRANEILSNGFEKVPRIDFIEALGKAERFDYRTEYIKGLIEVIDMDVIAETGVRIGADTLGGASIDYWPEIAKQYNLNLVVLNDTVDPRFPFVTLDYDDKIRMDCSSPDAMAGTVALANAKGSFDIVTGNDGDSDRHGIAARDSETGEFKLMNPNHFLAVSIDYLFSERRDWPKGLGVGKTVVSSSLIDRVTEGLGARLFEVPVGMKWFVDGFINGKLGFGGEESAGASFLRYNGTTWTTDKDGIIMVLLAAEILAKTGKTPAEMHRQLTDKYGESWYQRIDAPATLEERTKLSKLNPDQVTATELAGEPIIAKLTEAPGNGAKIGGLKVVTENAWFAARPSGTENVYKIYAESFISHEHLIEVQTIAREVVTEALR